MNVWFDSRTVFHDFRTVYWLSDNFLLIAADTECIHDYLLVISLYEKDLKSDRCRTQMAAARAVLEKSTMMLLTTTKVHSHHVSSVNLFSTLLSLF